MPAHVGRRFPPSGQNQPPRSQHHQGDTHHSDTTPQEHGEDNVTPRRPATTLPISLSISRSNAPLFPNEHSSLTYHPATMSDSDSVPSTELRQCPLFAELSEAELHALAQRFEHLEVPAGTRIFDFSDPSREVYFLLSGEVKVLNHTWLGDDFDIGHLGAGAYFGELSALDGGPRSAEVETASDCVLLKSSPETFEEVLKLHPEILLAVAKNLAATVRKSNTLALNYAPL